MDTQQPVFLDRASRGTRGRRMTKLLDEEIEEDEVFWNQDALNEEENDVEYEEEAEVADVYDSDFDDDEPEADVELENEPDERSDYFFFDMKSDYFFFDMKCSTSPCCIFSLAPFFMRRTRTKKKLIFPGKPPMKKKKNKVLSKIEKIPEGEKISEQSSPDEQHDAPDDAEVEKIVRKSTRTSVIIRQAERDAIRAALQATTKPIKKKKEGEEKRMTQEEMLLEAAQTEIMNLRNLERVLAREEEVKKRAIVHKQVYSGPKIHYLSRYGSSYLNFTSGTSFQSEISTTSIPYPEKAFCAVTGLPAIYRDPKTQLPYATKEAFKIIRERFAQERSCSQDRGALVGLLSDATFERKRKRSIIPHHRETSFPRPARFRRIPALEIQDSD